MTAARPPRRLAPRARRLHSGFDGLQPRLGELRRSRRSLAAPDGATWLLAMNAVSVSADRGTGPSGRFRRRGSLDAEAGRPSLLILGAMIAAGLLWHHFILRRRGWAPRVEPMAPASTI